MKLTLSLIGVTVIVAVVFCLWLNWATEQEEKEHEKNNKRLSKHLCPIGLYVMQ